VDWRGDDLGIVFSRNSYKITMKNTLPKKFWILIHSEEHCKLVQNKLFELGQSWNDNNTSYLKVSAYPYGELCISNNDMGNDDELAYATANFYKEHPSVFGKQISTDFLLSCKVGKQVSVVLNTDYTAIVSNDGIKVGCQTFSLDIIQKLVDAQKRL